MGRPVRARRGGMVGRRALVATGLVAVGLPVGSLLLPAEDAGAAPPAARCAITDGTTLISGNINSYAGGAVTENAGSTVLDTVGFSGSFAVGNRVMIIQMQDATYNASNNNSYGAGNGSGRGWTSTGSTGAYELRTITGISGSSITINAGLSNTYNHGDFGGRRARWQVVRVPVYGNVTLSGDLVPDAWDGTRGGILALQALGTVNMNGRTATATGRGFRGGSWMVSGNPPNNSVHTDYVGGSSDLRSQKGEGAAGTPDTLGGGAYTNGSYGRGAPANAGGGGNSHNAGGGGGAGAGSGGRGGRAYGGGIFGAALPVDDAAGLGGVGRTAGASTLLFGGGGGMGHLNGATQTGQGGAGGGIVFMTAAQFTGGGAARSNGANGVSAGDDGGGGGGGGGTVLVAAVGPNPDLGGIHHSINGGNGGDTGNGTFPLGPGGGGGGGTSLIYGNSGGPFSTGGGSAGSIPNGGKQNAVAGDSGWSGGFDPNGLQPTSCDFSDGPSSYGDPSNEVTNTLTNGAVLRIGAVGPDGEIDGGNRSSAANADDVTGTDDEDGIGTPPTLATGQGTYSVTVPVANTTGGTATLVGWVDADRNGAFSAAEGTTTTVANGATSATLNWTGLSPTAGTSLLRLRIAPSSTGLGTSSITNHLVGGEVEDHPLTIAANADLAVSQSLASTVNAGGRHTVSVTVTNNGPGASSGITLTNALPAGVTYVSATSGCGASGQTVTCSIASLASGASSTSTITFDVPVGTASGTTLTNTATVAAAIPDPNGANNTTNATTTVAWSSDVVAAASVPGTVVAGGPLTYTLSATNNGPSTSAGATITLPLPTGVTFGSAAAGCTNAAGTVTCNLGAIAPGGTASATVTGTLAASTAVGASVSATATLTATGDSTPGNNAAVATFTASRSTDIAVSFSGPSSVTAGSPISYTLGATNNGPSDATNVQVRHTLVTPVSYSTMPSGCHYASLVITCTRATLAAGASVSWTPTGTLPATTPAGTLPNAVATVTSTTTDPVSANNTSAPVSTTVISQADLGVTLSGTTSANAGTQAVYTASVTNNGPAGATGAVLSLTLPAGLSVVSATGCTTTGGVVTCDLGAIASAATVSRSVTVLVASTVGAGAMPLLASVTSTSNDPQPTNNTSGTTLTAAISADLATSISSPTTVVAGNQMTSTITVTNNGPSESATTSLTIPLPNGTTLASASAGCSAAGGTVTCALGTLAAGATTPVTLVLTVAPGTAASTSLALTATAAGGAADAVSTNNSATSTTTVTRSADLSAAVSVPAAVGAGTSTSITVTATNAGPSTAGATTIVVPVPAGTTFVSADAGCTASAGSVTCSLTDLAAGATTTRTIVVSVPASTASGTVFSASATVNGTSTDPVSANNSPAPVTRNITASADVSATLAAVGSVIAGSTYTLTATVTASGPADATATTVVVPLPTGTSLASAPAGCTPGGTAPVTVTCTLGTLTPGTSTTRSLVINVPPASAPGTTLSSTATAASAVTDPVGTNNTSSAATTSVTAEADLAATASATGTATAGSTATATLTVTNAGPSDAASVTGRLTLGAGLSVTAAPAGCTVSGSALDCALGVVAAGATTTRTVPLALSASVADGATLTVTPSVSAGTTDPAPANNTGAAAGITALRRADLAAAKTGPATLIAGTTGTWTISVTNRGPSDAVAVVLSDTLPVGVAPTDAADCTITGSVVACPVGDLAVGATATRTLTARLDSGVAAGSTRVNPVSATATTVDPSIGDNAATATTAVTASSDLAVTLSAPGTAAAGDTVTVTATVNAAGPSRSIAPVLTWALPAGATLLGGDAGCAAAADGTPTCTLLDLDPGAGTNRSIQVRLAAGLTDGSGVTFAATVRPPAGGTTDPTPGNDTANASITLANRADLALVGTLPDTVTAGATTTATFTVTNNGPSNASGVRLTLPLPAGLTAVEGGPCASGPGGPGGSGVVTCTVGSPAAGAQVSVVLALRPASTMRAAGIERLDLTATVSGTTADPDPSDDTVALGASLVDAADLSVTAAAPAALVAGTSASMSLTVENTGPSSSRGVIVTLPLPVGLTATSIPAGCVATTSLVVCNAGTLAAGTSTTLPVALAVDATVNPGALSLVSATVDATTPDPDTTDNVTAPAGTVVSATADLSVSVSAPGTVTAGATLPVTYEVGGSGPSAGHDVTVDLPLPAGLSVELAPGCTTVAGGPDGDLLRCPLGTVAPGSVAGGTVVLRASPGLAAGTVTRIGATVSASSSDPSTRDNTAAGVDVTVERRSDLAVSITAGAAVDAGGTLAVGVAVDNLGLSDAEGVVVTLPRPAGVTSVDAAECSVGQVTIECALDPVPAGGSGTATFVLQVDATTDAPTSLTLAATVRHNGTDPVAANDQTGDRTVPVLRRSALAAVLTIPATVTAGATTTATLGLRNLGPSDAGSATVTAALPAGLVLVSASPECTPVGASIHCVAGTVPAGSSWSGGLVLRAESDLADTDTLTLTSAVDSASEDPDGSDDTAAATIGVDVEVRRTLAFDAPEAATAGTTTTATLVVGNEGPSSAPDAPVTITLPVGVTLVDADVDCVTVPAGDPADPAAPVRVACATGRIAAGADRRIDLQLALAPGMNPGSLVTVEATIDDLAESVQVRVEARADALVTATPGAAAWVAGTTIRPVVTVTNLGPSDSPGRTVRLSLPEGTTGLDGDGCVPAGDGLDCTTGPIAAGASVTLGPGVRLAASITTGASRSLGVNLAGATVTVPDPAGGNDGTTVTASVERRADLSVHRTAPTTAMAGGTIETSVTVTNAGPSDATAPVIELPMAPGTTLESPPEGCDLVDAMLTCRPAELAVGAATVIPVTLRTAPAAVPGTVVEHRASVTADTLDPEAGNNAAAVVSTSLTDAADLNVAVAAPATLVAGGHETVTITVGNDGPSDATEVVVDLAAAGATLDTGDARCEPGTGRCLIPRVAAGEPTTILASVRLAPDALDGSTATVAATVTSATTEVDPADDTASAGTTVTTSGDLRLTATGPSGATAGAPTEVTFTVANSGPSVSRSVLLEVTMAPGMRLDTGEGASPPGCSAPEETGIGGVVRCVIAELQPGAPAARRLRVVLDPAAGSGTGWAMTGSVTAMTADPTPGDNTASTSTIDTLTSADLGAVLSATATAGAGTAIELTGEVRNDGPSVAREVTALLTGIDGLRIDTVTLDGAPVDPAANAPDPDPAANGTGAATDTVIPLGDLAPGLVRRVVIGATVRPGVPGGSVLMHRLRAASTTPDPDPADDRATASTDVTAAADLAASIAAPESTVAGETVTVSAGVRNHGPADARGVTITVPVPVGTAVTDPGPGCVPVEPEPADGPAVRCTVGRLPAGSETTVHLGLTVDPAREPGTTLNLGAVAAQILDADTADPDTGNNTAATAATVVGRTDLSVALDTSDTVTAGASVPVVVTIRNDGPSAGPSAVRVSTGGAGAAWDPATLPAGCALDADTATAVSCLVDVTGPGVSVTRRLSLTPAAGAAAGASVSVEATSSPAGGRTDSDATGDRATATLTVTNSADLGIAATVGAATAGSTSTLGIEVTNQGPSDAEAVTVTGVMPAGLTVDAPAGCAALDGVLVCALGRLAPGTVARLSIPALVSSSATSTGALLTTLTVSSTTPDPDPIDNTVAATPTSVRVQAGLDARLDLPPTLVAGRSVTGMLTVTNLGPSDARAVRLQVSSPPGTTVTLDPVGGASAPNLDVADLAVGASFTVPVTLAAAPSPAQGTSMPVVAEATGEHTTGADGTGSGARVTTTATIATEADLSTRLLVEDRVTAGRTTTATYLVTNAGPSDAVDVTLVEVPPAGFRLAEGDHGCTTRGDGAVLCRIDRVAAGETVSREVPLAVDAATDAGTVARSLAVLAVTADPDPSDNTSATVEVEVRTEADLRSVVTAPAEGVAGTPITATATVTNHGPSAARSVTIMVPTPDGTRIASVPEGCSEAAASVLCTVGTLEPGAEATVTVSHLIDSALTEGARIEHSARATGAVVDPEPGDNGASVVVTTVRARADLAVSLAAPSEVVAGSRAELILLATDTGPSDATDVVVALTLPAGLALLDGGPCVADAADGAVRCALGTIRSGDARSVIVPVSVASTAAPGSTLTAEASVGSGTTDPDPADNLAAPAEMTVTTSADLSVSLTDAGAPGDAAGSGSVVAGTTTRVRVGVHNEGPSDAAGVSVVLTLPPGMSAPDAPEGCLGAAGTLTCSLPASLSATGPGASRLIEVPLVAAPDLASGAVVRVGARVAASTPDPAEGDNEATPVELSVIRRALLSVEAGVAARAVAGTTTTLALRVADAGPSSASAVDIAVELPDGVALAEGAPTECSVGGRVLRCGPAELSPGGEHRLEVPLALAADLEPGRTLEFRTTATIDGSATDATHTTALTVEGAAALRTTLTGPSRWTAGTDGVFTGVITAAGPSDARSVAWTLEVPAGVTATAAPGCAVSAAGRRVDCMIGTLTPGTSRTVEVPARLGAGVAPGAELVATAEVGGSVADPGPIADRRAGTPFTVERRAALSVSVSAPGSVTAGRSFTATATVHNDGPSDATEVDVTAVVPADLQVNPAAVRVERVAAGADAVVSFEVQVPTGAAAGRVLATGATVRADGLVVNAAQTEPAPGGAPADPVVEAVAAASVVVAEADLAVGLDAPPALAAGTTAVARLWVRNDGPSTATEVEVDLDLPAGFTLAGGVAGCDPIGAAPVCRLGDLSAGATVERMLPLEVAASVTPGERPGFVARVVARTVDPDAGDDTVTVTGPAVTATANLTVTVGDPGEVVAGEVVMVPVEVTNAGPADAREVTVVVPLPEGVLPAGGACSPLDRPEAAGGPALSCTLGTVPAGADTSMTVPVRLDPTARGELTLTPTVTSTTPGDRAVVTPRAGWPISVTTALQVEVVAPSAVTAGAASVWTVRVRNEGPAAALDGALTLAGSDGVAVGPIEWAPGTPLGPSTTRVVSVPVTPAPGVTGEVTLTATLTTADAAPVSEQASAPVETWADLSVIAVAAPTVAGTTGRINLTVRNAGPSVARSVVVTDLLPGADEPVVVALGDLDPGASRTVTVDLPVAADAQGPVRHHAQVSSLTPDPFPADNLAGDLDITVERRADLAVTVLAPQTAVAGTEVAVDLGVRNAGPSVARSVTVTDVLPEGVTVSESPEGCSVEVATRTVNCVVDVLAPGESTVWTLLTRIDAGVAAGALAPHRAAVVAAADDDPIMTDNAADSVGTVVRTDADLAVQATLDTEVVAGRPATITVTVMNRGPSDAAGVSVSVGLPAGVEPGANGVECTAPAEGVTAPAEGVTAGGQMVCVLGAVPAGAVRTLHLLVVPDSATAPGTSLAVPVTVAAATADSAPADNVTTTAPVTVATVAAVSVHLAAPEVVAAGRGDELTVTATNSGPSAARSTVVAVDLPEGISVRLEDPRCTVATVRVVCSLGDLAAGAGSAVTLPVEVSGEVADGAELPVDASVASGTADLDPENNVTGPIRMRVVARADLGVAITSPTAVTAGSAAEVGLTVTGRGPSLARDAVVGLALPAGARFLTARVGAAGGECSTVGGSVACTVGDLAPGAVVPVVVTLALDAATSPETPVWFTGSVAARTLDPEPADNTATSEPVAVSVSSDLSVRLAAPVAAEAGRTLGVDLTVAAAGPSVARSVLVTMPLPAGLTLSDAEPGCSSTAATLVCQVAELAPGASVTRRATLAVGASVRAGTTATLTTTVSADTPDPVTTNDVMTAPPVSLAAPTTVAVSGEAPATVTAGDRLLDVLHLVGTGPADAHEVRVTVDLPDGLTLADGASGGTCATAGARLGCTVPLIAAGATVTLRLPLEVASSVAAGSTLVRTVSVSGEQLGDPVTTEVRTTVTASADLLFTVDGPDRIIAGDTAAYTVTVENRGPSDAVDVQLTEDLPEGVTPARPRTGCAVTLDSVTCPVGTLAAGARTSRTLMVSFDPVLDGRRIDRRLAVTAVTADPNVSDNEARVEGPVAEGAADLSVQVGAPGSITAGTTGAVSVTVTNDGPSIARGVVAEAPLPPGVQATDAAPGCTPVDRDGTPMMLCRMGDLAAGATASRWFALAVPADATAPVTAGVTVTVSATTPDPDPTDNVSGEWSTAVATATSLEATVTATVPGGGPVVAGGTMTADLRVEAMGPSDAADVVVRLPLPAGLTLVDGVAGCARAAEDREVRCVLGRIGAGRSAAASVTLALAASAAAGSRLRLEPTAETSTTLTAPVVGQGVDLETEVAADLSMSVSGAAEAVAGAPFARTVLVRNAGPSDADEVLVELALPEGLSATGPEGCTFDGSTVRCPIGSVPSGGSRAVPLQLTPSSAAAPGTMPGGVVTVRSSTPDPDPGDDVTSMAPVTVRAEAGLEIAFEGPESVVAGDRAELTLVVGNRGPSLARNTRAVVTLPAGLRLVDGGACSTVDRLVVCPVGELSAGASARVGMTLTAASSLASSSLAAGSVVRPTATVGADTPLTRAADPAVLELPVVARADVSVGVSGPSMLAAGAAGSFPVRVANAGPSDADGVVVTLALPTGVRSGASSPCTAVEAGLSCTVGRVPAGGVSMFTVSPFVDPSVPPGGELAVVASVAAATPLTNEHDDRAEARFTVDALADLDLRVTAPAAVAAGDVVSFALLVGNRGPSPAREVTVGADLPAGLTPTVPQGCTFERPQLRCPMGLVAAGDSVSLPVTALVADDLADGSVLSIGATVATVTADPDGAAPSATASIAAANRATLTLDVDADASGVLVAGTEAPVELVVGNDGPSPAHEVVATVRVGDAVDAPVRGVSMRRGAATVAAGGPAPTGVGNDSAGTSQTDPGTGNLCRAVAGPTGNTGATGGTGAGVTGTVLECRVGRVGSGQRHRVVVPIPVAANATGQLPIEVEVVSTTATTSTGPVRTALRLPVTTRTALTPVLTLPETVAAGADLTVGIEVSNPAPSDAAAATVDLRLPPGVLPVAGGCTPAAASTLRCDLGRVAAGAVVRRDVRLTVDPGLDAGRLRFEARTADGASTAEVSVRTSADLSVAVAVPRAAVAGGTARLQARITNLGPSESRGVLVGVSLPRGLLVATPPAGCVRDTEDASLLRCDLGTLASGMAVPLEVTAAVDPSLPPGAPLTAVVTSGSSTEDPVAGNGRAEVDLGSVVVGNNVAVRVSGGESTVRTGDRVALTVDVVNTGVDEVRDVVVVQSWPSKLGAAAVEGMAPGCSVEAAAVVCRLARLAPGARHRHTVNGTGDASGGGRVASTVLATLAGAETDVSDNRATWSALLSARAALQVTKTPDRTEAEVGQDVIYTVDLVNRGPDRAGSVSVVEMLPRELRIVEGVGTAGRWDADAAVWRLDELAVGASARLILRTTLLDTGEVVNRVRATSDVEGVDLGEAAGVNAVAATRVLAREQDSPAPTGAVPAVLAFTGGELPVVPGLAAVLLGLLLVVMARRRRDDGVPAAGRSVERSTEPAVVSSPTGEVRLTSREVKSSSRQDSVTMYPRSSGRDEGVGQCEP